MRSNKITLFNNKHYTEPNEREKWTAFELDYAFRMDHLILEWL